MLGQAVKEHGSRRGLRRWAPRLWKRRRVRHCCWHHAAAAPPAPPRCGRGAAACWAASCGVRAARRRRRVPSRREWTCGLAGGAPLRRQTLRRARRPPRVAWLQRLAARGLARPGLLGAKDCGRGRLRGVLAVLLSGSSRSSVSRKCRARERCAATCSMQGRCASALLLAKNPDQLSWALVYAICTRWASGAYAGREQGFGSQRPVPPPGQPDQRSCTCQHRQRTPAPAATGCRRPPPLVCGCRRTGHDGLLGWPGAPCQGSAGLLVWRGVGSSRPQRPARREIPHMVSRRR